MLTRNSDDAEDVLIDDAPGQGVIPLEGGGAVQQGLAVPPLLVIRGDGHGVELLEVGQVSAGASPGMPTDDGEFRPGCQT